MMYLARQTCTKSLTTLSSKVLLNNVGIIVNRSYSTKKQNINEESLTKPKITIDQAIKNVDFEFIANRLGVKMGADQIKSIKESIKNETSQDMPEAMMQLEHMLHSDQGKKYLGVLIADIKATFGLEGEAEMTEKAAQVDKETSLRIGEPIQQFLARVKDVEPSQLPGRDREILQTYIDAHPYVRHTRQLNAIMDIVDIAQIYNQTDSQTFNEKMAQRFGDSLKGADVDINDVDYLAKSEGFQDGATVRGSAQREMQDRVIEMIKNDTITLYLDRVFENASRTVNPVTSSQLSAQETARRLEIAREARKKVDSLSNMTEIDRLEAQDNNGRTYQIEDGRALTDMEYAEENALIPQIDLLRPESEQQQLKDPRDFLKYYRLYPRKVREWIDYSHTPLGFFTEMGVWYNFPEWYAKMYPAMAPEQLITSSAQSTDEIILPDDLQGHYRFGVTKEEADVLHPKFRDFLTFRHASQKEVNQHRKKLCIQKYGKDSYDSGHSSVQIAIFTEKINYLETHIARNNRDKLARRQMMLLQSKRKQMIEYLKRTDVQEYFRITKDLKIKNANTI